MKKNMLFLSLGMLFAGTSLYPNIALDNTENNEIYETKSKTNFEFNTGVGILPWLYMSYKFINDETINNPIIIGWIILSIIGHTGFSKTTTTSHKNKPQNLTAETSKIIESEQIEAKEDLVENINEQNVQETPIELTS